MGAMYTTFLEGFYRKTLRIANSAMMVFPEPVGAPTRTFSSLWKSV
jgi:hypothetical protein